MTFVAYWVLFAAIVAAVVVLVIAFVAAAIVAKRQRRSGTRRGFEVDLNTGSIPVPEKKEIDHG